VERIADFVLRHRLAIIAFWAVAMVAGFAATGRTIDRLTTDFSVPGQPGFDTARMINTALGHPTDNGPSLPVITVPPGQTVDQRRADIKAVWDKVRAEHPGWRIADWASSGEERLVTKDRRSTYAVVYGPQAKNFNEKPLGVRIPAEYGPQQGSSADALAIGGTGYFELSIADAQGGGSSNGPGLLLEVLLGGLGALAILAFVFASFLALLPIVIAIVAIPVTFGALLPITYALDMSVVLQFLVGLIGLGVAIDYSLLVVTRWREERDHGHSNDEAVRIAIVQAGHSVVFSGAAVAIGLVSLTVLNVPCSSR
jgi:RND superfamily putative drug exporter